MKQSILALLIISLLCGCAGKSDGVENVLVVANTRHSDSIDIAQYYIEKRNINPANFCKIECPTDEVIKPEIYDKQIASPISDFMKKHKIEDTVDYIVLTRGMPLRTTENWGVDSSLTSLATGWTSYHENPYFASDKPFSRKEFGIYLVTRLDGLTAADAKALVDRSLAAKPGNGPFLMYFDPGW